MLELFRGMLGCSALLGCQDAQPPLEPAEDVEDVEDVEDAETSYARYRCEQGLPDGKIKPLPAPGEMRRCLEDTACDEAFVVAHRGNRQLGAPKNSLQSLRDTAAAHIPMAEVDVRTTADGVMVLMHDATIDRTTSGSGAVRELDWASLQDVSLTAADEQTHTVPTLEDAMLQAKELGIALYLDIKDVELEALVESIHRHDARNWALIRTSNVTTLDAVYRLDPMLWAFLSVDSLDQAFEARALLPSLTLVEVQWSAALALTESLRTHGFHIQPDLIGAGDTVWRLTASMADWLDRRQAGAQLLQTDLPSELLRALCLDDAGWVE